ncbi:transglutaminase-like domain-containing protein [Deefgea rivuli]|uniref:transglutaminase-like domain-containing protein n=1 Tax=Deefgea rivuli TaxID=400948 RepID=UPI000688F5B4|nr:transglutaminase family protein [Deefgea rivuli]
MPNHIAPYLGACDVIDASHPHIQQLAQRLRAATPSQTALECFNWVRDEIAHCLDAGRDEVSCIASDVLALGTSFCYGKSHLLVALLRANGIAAGLCYQRLTFAGTNPPFCLHGLVAVWLNGAWTRCDPRGNKPGIDAQFTVGQDNLAFAHTMPGECLYPDIYAAPWPELVAALAGLKQASQFRWLPIDLLPPTLSPLPFVPAAAEI